MAYKMGDLRNLQNNLYFFVASGLDDYGYTVLSGYDQNYVHTGVYLVREEPKETEEIKIPAIALCFNSENEEPLEIGTVGTIQTLDMSLRIFGRSKGERDDLSSILKFILKRRTMNIYDLNEFYEEGTYSKIGYADFDQIRIIPIWNNTTLRTLEHQSSVSFNCEYTVAGLSLIDFDH